MVCLGNEQRSFCHFETAPKYFILDSFVDYEGYSIYSKRVFPTVVVTMDIWIPVHVSSLFPKTSTFSLAISCLTTSGLPWLTDLTFQVPMQYCSLQHQTLLPSPVTSTTGCCFRFGSICSFFLELFLHCSPVAYWAPTNLGSSSFSVMSFCLLILFMVCSRQGYWSHLPFPSPVAIFCQNSLPCLGWPYMAWLAVSLSQTRLWSVWSVRLVFCDLIFILSVLWWIRIRDL